MAKSYDLMLMEIGTRIAMRRQELNMSQSELAIQADLTAAALSRIESGQTNPRTDTLVRIASALQVPLSNLQPNELDQYINTSRELQMLGQKLQRLSPAERLMLYRMFDAQIDVIRK